MFCSLDDRYKLIVIWHYRKIVIRYLVNWAPDNSFLPLKITVKSEVFSVIPCGWHQETKQLCACIALLRPMSWHQSQMLIKVKKRLFMAFLAIGLGYFHVRAKKREWCPMLCGH